MIFEACPFNNENLVASIKVTESDGFVDQLHICEANRTFQFTPKPYNFLFDSDARVHYKKLDADKMFKGERFRFHRKHPFFSKSVNPWVNERIQRNYCSASLVPGDRDLVVLSDIDEIIDSRHWPQVIHEAKKHGIVTIGLHFTLYYFNLFSDNFAGPPDYSYRVFAMTGQRFNEMKISSDRLRKLGEAGRLKDTVHRIPGVMGFHHSWLGDTDFIKAKLLSYSHDRKDHDAGLYSPDGSIAKERIDNLLLDKKSVFGEVHQLQIRNDIPQLHTVELQRYGSLLRFFA
jgi:hypothetical protein